MQLPFMQHKKLMLSLKGKRYTMNHGLDYSVLGFCLNKYGYTSKSGRHCKKVQPGLSCLTQTPTYNNMNMQIIKLYKGKDAYAFLIIYKIYYKPWTGVASLAQKSL
jgi:hypothetical protein